MLKFFETVFVGVDFVRTVFVGLFFVTSIILSHVVTESPTIFPKYLPVLHVNVLTFQINVFHTHDLFSIFTFTWPFPASI